jgi:hypothetical protein
MGPFTGSSTAVAPGDEAVASSIHPASSASSAPRRNHGLVDLALAIMWP